MPEDTKQKIQKLNQKLATLKKKQDPFNEEARQWARKRDKIHKQTKDLLSDVMTIKARRDLDNAKVKTLKNQRNFTRNLVNIKITEIKQLREDLKILEAKQPRRNIETIRTDLEKIEWEIQTTSLTLQEERPLVKRANELQKKLNIYQQIFDKRTQISKLQQTIEKMNEEAGAAHKQLSDLALRSQEFHDKMQTLLSKVNEMKPEANEYHKNFLLNKQRSQKIQENCLEVEAKIQATRKKMQEKEEKDRLKQHKARLRKLRGQAQKKLDEGGKLTLEEFKLLSAEEKT